MMSDSESPPPHLEAAPVAALPQRWLPEASALFGFIAGFALLAIAVVLGGSPGFFIDGPSLIIVLGGTLSVLAVCYPFHDLADAGKAVWATFTDHLPDPQEMAVRLLRVAEHARRFGPLTLQNVAYPIAGSPFLDQALAMAIDGTPEPALEAALHSDQQANLDGVRHAAAVLRRAADVAPALGLIGTLVGLVQMLRNLDDPASMGPGMAVALLTTFYGAILGHMVFTPLASKLERKAAAETLIRQLCVLTALSVSRRENPRLLEQAMNSTLPPRKRIKVFD